LPEDAAEELASTRNAFFDMLEEVRRYWADQATALGLPTSQREVHMEVHSKEDDPEGWSSTWGERVTSCVDDVHAALLHANRPRCAQGVPAVAREIAEEFAARFSSNLPFYRMALGRLRHLLDANEEMRATDYATDPAGWVEAHMLEPAAASYIQNLSDLRQPDRAAAASLFDQLVQQGSADTETWLVRMPVSGLICPESLTDEEYTVRPMTPAERGLFVRIPDPSDEFGASLTFWQARRSVPSHLIERRVHLPRGEQLVHHGSSAILTALQLLGYDVAGGHAVIAYHPRFLQEGRVVSPVPLPVRAGESKALSASDWATAVKLSRRVASSSAREGHPGSPAELALHRFSLGCSRDEPVDAVVDFTVCLEAILLPYQPEARQGEVRYRFLTHGSLYFESNPERRAAVRKLLDNIYSVRSALVHGVARKDAPDIDEAMRAARELAAIGLRNCLDGGFPTGKDFTDAVLGIRALR
jgi:hypothetical protein